MSAQDIILTVAGIYNTSFAMINVTNNWRSALIYKVVPFFVGLACLYAAWGM